MEETHESFIFKDPSRVPGPCLLEFVLKDLAIGFCGFDIKSENSGLPSQVSSLYS